MFRFQGFRSFNSLFHRSQSFRLARFSSQPNVTDGRVARKGMYQRYHNRGGLKASALVAGTLAISAGIAYDVTTNTNGFLAKQFAEIKKIMEPIKNKLFGAYLQEVFEPTTDKILPDWGDQTFYPGVPKGSPAPQLLIVDLEKTLIGSVYDAKHGWRHVKRPGLDRFIKELSAYYEIAIISENDLGLVEPVLMAIDPEGRCHKFGPNVSEMRGIHILKRLDLMNRDIRKIILIDDDPNASQLFPRNTLLIKPYTDIRENDRTLEELIPLLQAFVHEDPRDFRDTIDSLGTHDASECAIEYRMRVERKKQEEQEKRRRGLGGVIRGSKSNANTDDDDYYSRSSILSPKDIVGGVPVENLAATASFIPVVNYPGSKKEEKAPVEKKKGLLFKRLDEMEKQKEEEEMRKREVMLRIQNDRMMAMQKQQQQQQQQ